MNSVFSHLDYTMSHAPFRNISNIIIIVLLPNVTNYMPQNVVKLLQKYNNFLTQNIIHVIMRNVIT